MVAFALNNPAVQSYILYSAILALKLLVLSPMTGVTRVIRGVFANPEDAKTIKGGKVKFDDPVVERIRRAHLNDLENIPAFWVLGALYVTTGPVAAWATLLFRAYTLGRILHTIVYAVVPLPQPARAIAFVVPAFISFYMGLQSYLLYSSVLGLKVLSMAFLTARVRYAKNVFANPEDAAAKKGKVKYDDPDVERVRRAHLNDLENIPVFWVLGALYLTTAPSAWLATTLFRVYTAGRVIHTLVYAVKPLPQPARGIAFGIPLMITFYMGVKVIMHYSSAL
ncbi:hypothetical protein SFRURICE_004483 [Spodoptera frugiperda]|nr:hypothetical protein SFRURICE_004483 [Spodoptera frugiperda]